MRNPQEFGFRAVLNFPIRTPEGTVTDVDVAAAKDGFLFVGQTKVLIYPDSVYDDWKVLDNLRKAAAQLKRSLPHISLLEDRLGLSEAEFLIVPFLLTNVWGFTGAVVEGFKVIDFSSLSMLLTGGEIWKVQFGDVPSREIRKLIRGAQGACRRCVLRAQSARDPSCELSTPPGLWRGVLFRA